MKILISFAAVCFSVNAFACPYLEGKWNCQHSDGNSSVTEIVQQNIPGGVHYRAAHPNGEFEDIFADGTQRTTEEADQISMLTMTCQGDSVIEGRQVMKHQKYPLASEIYIHYNLNGNQLSVEAKGSVNYNGASEPISVTSVCTRP